MVRKLGILAIPVVGGGAFLATNLLTKDSARVPFKKRFSNKPNRVLLDSSGSNHDEVWTAMVQEFKKNWDNSLPFKSSDLNIDKLKSYCSSLERDSNSNDFEKFERHCSRNNYSSSYTSKAIPKGDALWDERRKNWRTDGNFIPNGVDANGIEDWCLNKGSSPFAAEHSPDDSSYAEHCLETVQAKRREL